jgi:hypothetical protein
LDKFFKDIEKYNKINPDDGYYQSISRITRSKKEKIIERFIDFEELVVQIGRKFPYFTKKSEEVKNSKEQLNRVYKRINKYILEFHRKNEVKVEVEILTGLVQFYFPKIIYSNHFDRNVSKKQATNEILNRIKIHKKEYDSVVECFKYFSDCVKHPNAERRGMTLRNYVHLLLTKQYYRKVDRFNDKVSSEGKSLYQIFQSFYNEIDAFYKSANTTENRTLESINAGTKRGERPKKSRDAQLEFFKKVQEVSKVSNYSIIKLIAQLIICLSNKSGTDNNLELEIMMNRIKSQIYEDSRRAFKHNRI